MPTVDAKEVHVNPDKTKVWIEGKVYSSEKVYLSPDGKTIWYPEEEKVEVLPPSPVLEEIPVTRPTVGFAEAYYGTPYPIHLGVREPTPEEIRTREAAKELKELPLKVGERIQERLEPFIGRVPSAVVGAVPSVAVETALDPLNWALMGVSIPGIPALTGALVKKFSALGLPIEKAFKVIIGKSPYPQFRGTPIPPEMFVKPRVVPVADTTPPSVPELPPSPSRILQPPFQEKVPSKEIPLPPFQDKPFPSVPEIILEKPIGTVKKVFPDETVESIKIVTKTIKEAKNVKGAQEAFYHQARVQQHAILEDAFKKGVLTEEQFIEAKKAIGKVDFTKVTFEPIREKVTQKIIDDLFKFIGRHPDLTAWDRLNAGKALGKLCDGIVPADFELKLLRQTFGKEFVETITKKWPLWKRFTEATTEITNVPRAIICSFDLSAPFNQAWPFISRKEFWRNYFKMFSYWKDKEVFEKAMKAIRERPSYQEMIESGINFSDVGAPLSKREELFYGAELATKIPVVGKGVAASNRAYCGFLNNLRADLYDNMRTLLIQSGKTPEKHSELFKSIAEAINTGTGRGSMGQLEEAVKILNAAFFAPRYAISMLNQFNPAFYIGLKGPARTELLKGMLASTTAGITLLALLKAWANANSYTKKGIVEIDDRMYSPNFGRIELDDVIFDIWGGRQPYARLFAQLITGKTVRDNKVIELGTGYPKTTRKTLIDRFFRGRLSPMATFVTDWLDGKTLMGEPFEIDDATIKLFTPLAIGDILEVSKEWGPIGGMCITPFAVAGFPRIYRFEKWKKSSRPLDAEIEKIFRDFNIKKEYEKKFKK